METLSCQASQVAEVAWEWIRSSAPQEKCEGAHVLAFSEQACLFLKAVAGQSQGSICTFFPLPDYVRRNLLKKTLIESVHTVNIHVREYN